MPLQNRKAPEARCQAQEADAPPVLLYTMQQLARMTNQGLTVIYRDIALGKLRTVKNGRSRRVTLEQAREYIARMTDA